MKRKWNVFYIEERGDLLVSCKTQVSAFTKELAKRKIDNNDKRMVTGVEPAWLQRHKKE